MAVGEWDRRELCPDGACTGLIGPEGTCKVCGRAAPNWGEPRTRGLDASAGADADADSDADADDDDEYEDDDDEEDPIAPSAKAEIGEWKTRTLCPDGACVGVIGADGTCKVCGKAADGSAADAADGSEDDAADGGDDEDDAAAEADAGDDEGDDEGDEDSDAEDGDSEDDELAAAAADLAGVAPASEVEAATNLATRSGDPDDDRQLCPDGGCIGVIGENGKCKVCGKAAA